MVYYAWIYVATEFVNLVKSGGKGAPVETKSMISLLLIGILTNVEAPKPYASYVRGSCALFRQILRFQGLLKEHFSSFVFLCSESESRSS